MSLEFIFKKKLSKCKNLFYKCDQISEIDISNFDCSQIVDCSGMFEDCSKLTILKLGQLNFALSSNFGNMFKNCGRLGDLDVSFFDTKNSITFKSMFEGCSRLKEIDVSKFESSKCKDISNMFCNCSSISSIDMINWNMESIIYGNGLTRTWYTTTLFIGYNKLNKRSYYDGIYGLFNGCSNLKSIKMSSNFSYLNSLLELNEKKKKIFKGLPNSGTFIWKKGVNCDQILSLLPVSWNRLQE